MAFGDYMPRRFREQESESERRLMQSPVPRLSRMLDEMFSDVFSGGRASPLSSFNPRVNVSDSEGEIKIVAELPGMDEKDIELTLTRDAIVVRGEKKEETKDNGRNGYYECSYGTFERYIPLPADVRADDVKASFDKGLLTITLPKTDDARSRSKKIPIQSSAGGKAADMGMQSKRSNGSQAHDGAQASR